MGCKGFPYPIQSKRAPYKLDEINLSLWSGKQEIMNGANNQLNKPTCFKCLHAKYRNSSNFKLWLRPLSVRVVTLFIYLLFFGGGGGGRGVGYLTLQMFTVFLCNYRFCLLNID